MRISDWSSDVCSSDLFRPESESLRPTLPHHAVDNGILILQAKVEMTRCRTLEPGNLATQLHIAETVLHSTFQHGGNFRNAKRRRVVPGHILRSEEHTSEPQSPMRISYAVFSLKTNKQQKTRHNTHIS